MSITSFNSNTSRERNGLTKKTFFFSGSNNFAIYNKEVCLGQCISQVEILAKMAEVPVVIHEDVMDNVVLEKNLKLYAFSNTNIRIECFPYSPSLLPSSVGEDHWQALSCNVVPEHQQFSDYRALNVISLVVDYLGFPSSCKKRVQRIVSSANPHCWCPVDTLQSKYMHKYMKRHKPCYRCFMWPICALHGCMHIHLHSPFGCCYQCIIRPRPFQTIEAW